MQAPSAPSPPANDVESCRALVALGKLTQDQYDDAMAEWRSQPPSGPRLTLVQVLIKRRIIRPQDLVLVRSSSRPTAVSGAPSKDSPTLSGMFGPYQIQREIGRGATGAVYEARRNLAPDGAAPRWGPQVALKVLRGSDASGTLTKRFEREAHALLDLEHPGIVRVFDFGVVGDKPYIVMELIRGRSLAQAMQEGQDILEGLEILADICEAMDEAHNLDFVHRDLKPSNILLAEDGAVVTDFGLVKDLTRETQLTKEGVSIGTPAYMAPEQVDSTLGPISKRTDIYALGVILYEMLTGTVPFSGENLVNQYKLILEAKPVPPSRINAELPPGAELVCLKALAKDPKDRYPTAMWMALDIRRVLGGEAPRASISEGTLTGRSRLKRGLFIAAIFLAALVPLAVGLILYLFRGE